MDLVRPFSLRLLLAFLLLNLSAFSASGQGFIWAQGFKDSLNDDAWITGHVIDGNNNGYFVGSFSGTTDFDPGSGVMNVTAVGDIDMFILKKDAAGNLLWFKHIVGTDPDTGQCYANGVALDGQGNLYISGSYTDTVDFDPGSGVYQLSTYSYSANGFVLKLNPSGEFVWAKGIGSPTTLSGFGIRYVKADAANNIFFVCGFSSADPCSIDVDPGAGVYNVLCQSVGGLLIEKLDTAGNFIWAKEISGPGQRSISALALDTMSNIYVTGQLNGTVDIDPGLSVVNLSGSQDIFIAKYDSACNYQWAGSITGGWDDLAGGIATDTFGNVIVTGNLEYGSADFDIGAGVHNFTEGMFALKLRNDGSFAWVKHIFTYEVTGASVTTDGEGNIYTCGGEFVQKTDSTGNDVWMEIFEGDLSAHVNAAAISIDQYNDVYTAGSYSYNSSVDFDPGPSQYLLPAAHGAFIVKLCGESMSLSLTGGSDTLCGGGDFAELSTPAVTGAVYTWTCNGAVVPGSNGNTINTTEPGIYKVYVDGGCPSASGAIYIYNCDGNLTGIASTMKSEDVEVYPNPADDVITIKTTLSHYTFTILNTLGQVVERRVDSGSGVLDVSQYHSGVYYLQIESNDGQVVNGKFVVGH